MSKKKNSDAFLQMVESGPSSEPSAAADSICVEEIQQPSVSTIDKPAGVPVGNPAKKTALLVEIPICDELPPSEFQIHIDLTLKPPLATILRRIASQLDRQGATLNSGKRVVQANTAFIWMMERLLESSESN